MQDTKSRKFSSANEEAYFHAKNRDAIDKMKSSGDANGTAKRKNHLRLVASNDSVSPMAHAPPARAKKAA
jgi:hypothetical protein